MMFKDSRVQKGPREGVCSLLRMTTATRREKRKEERKEYLTKRKTTKYWSPTVRNSRPPMRLLALSNWYTDVCGHIFQLHCLDPLCMFVKSLLRWQLQILHLISWVTNILHNIKAIILSTESFSAVSTLLSWRSLDLNFEKVSYF